MRKQLLPEHPLLKRHFFLSVVEPDEVFLFAENQIRLWKNLALKQLLPLLDGSRSISKLFEHLAFQLSPPEIIFLLNQLHGLGLLAEGSDSATTVKPGNELALWHALGVEEDRTLEQFRQSGVHLHELSHHTNAKSLTEALAELGVLVNDACDLALNVVVTDHYHRPELSQLNISALESGKCWMVCKLIGQTLWIGPIFRPGQTGCMECLQERLRLNNQIEDHVVHKTGDVSAYETSVAVLPAASRLGALWAAKEIALWLAGQTERLEGKLLSISTGTGGIEIATHNLARRPQCPVCGDPKNSLFNSPVVIQHQTVTYASDGGRRTENPELTFQRLQHHISPITGVVTWLTDTGQDSECLVHSFSAGHNFAIGPNNLYWLRHSIRSRTGGKGVTAIQAKVSAVGEAIERYSGVFRGNETRIRTTYRNLRDLAIHPHQCLLFSDQQYAQREVLNANNEEGFFHLIPQPFPEDLEIDWVPLWSLTHSTFRYLPAAYCYYGHPDIDSHFFCAGDANGCAAGSVLEEAILQAFLELVERDSAAIWWYNCIPRPGVDLESFAIPYLDRLKTHYERLGREFWAIDLTTDTQIPVFAAVSRRLTGQSEDLLIGLGAHLDPSLALLRAFTELNQFLPAVSRIDSNGNTIYSWPDDSAVRFWKRESIQTQIHLCPSPSMHQKTRSDFSNLAGVDLFDDVQTCLHTAHRLGLEVLVLNQSRPDIELNVARVVVPGMRHFWRRLGPGRLYDVPVQLGWLEKPLCEDDLNPISIFF